ncbi:MAG TPA: hypothetical protein DC049_09575, partial [Spirochaetia bacterium]|nr:hypothetical protein [Spirochaetia bacterium]
MEKAAAFYSRIRAASALNTFSIVDDYFPFYYTLDLYRGCTGGCIYCPGSRDLFQNPALIENFFELAKLQFPGIRSNALVGVGGGLNDVGAARPLYPDYLSSVLRSLKKIPARPFIVTKSAEIVKEKRLLSPDKSGGRSVVCMSFCAPDDCMAGDLEPQVSRPSERFSALAELAACGISTGICYMPVIPGFTDLENDANLLFKIAAQNGARFVLFNMLSLSPSGNIFFFK